MHSASARSSCPASWLALSSLALLFVPIITAQVAPAVDALALAKYDTNRNGRLDPDELAARQAAEAKAAQGAVASGAAESENTVQLSPFEVNATADRGYLATNSLSGTRLNSKLEDLAASITVVTKQQLLDTASVDINDIFTYEANTEGMSQYTEFRWKAATTR